MEYKEYVKKDKINEFENFCKINSVDFYSCGVLLTVHLILEELMRHKGENPKEKKVTPQQAWDYAISNCPYHSGMSASAVVLEVIYYSPRGKEFMEWAKTQDFLINWDEQV